MNRSNSLNTVVKLTCCSLTSNLSLTSEKKTEYMFLWNRSMESTTIFFVTNLSRKHYRLPIKITSRFKVHCLVVLKLETGFKQWQFGMNTCTVTPLVANSIHLNFIESGCTAAVVANNQNRQEWESACGLYICELHYFCRRSQQWDLTVSLH